MGKVLSIARVIAFGGFIQLANGTVLYDNTTSTDNYQANGWAVDATNGFSIADPFSLSSAGTLQSMNLWLWEKPTDPTTDDLESLSWSIVDNSGAGGNPFLGTTLFSGTDKGTGTYVETNTFGYSIFEESFNTGSLALNAGTTYWLILTNSTTASGNPVLWDQSDGPSSPTWESQLGNVTPTCAAQYFGQGADTCSESFQLSDAAVPEPGTVLLTAFGLIGLGLVRSRRVRGLRS